jgi:hypothetical protein
MKLTAIFAGIIIGLSSSVSFAALKCTDLQCDVKWKTNMGEIDLASVCYNFKGKSQYKECRSLAADVFAQRCKKGNQNRNQVWVDVYCGAAKEYKP